MAYWEFLLQQEGDHDWLPLETAHVEILEGRYRIMAHTSHCEVPAEIRLTQVLYDQMPPKRRTLSRAGSTNADGLMLVVPFTHLSAGVWTVQCTSTNPAIAWQYGVQIRVLPLEADPEDWQPDWPEAEGGESTAALPTFQGETGGTPALAPDLSDPWASPVESPAAAVGEPPEINPATLGTLPYRLHLQQQALVVQPGVPLALRGEVVAVEPLPPSGLPLPTTLWVQLRDPNQGTNLMHERRSLSLAALPTGFEVGLSLPATLETRLLVGEMSLWSATNAPQLLAIQGFTITVNLDQLLETIANQGAATLSGAAAFTEVGLEGLTAQAAAAAPTIPNVREVPFRRIYLPAAGLTLPPQIYRPLSAAAIGAPQLPPLPNQPVRPASPPLATEPTPRALELPPLGSAMPGDDAVPSPAAPTSAAGATNSPQGLDLPTFGRSGSSVAENPQPAIDPLITAAIAPDIAGNPTSTDRPLPGLPADQAFQSLNLQSRFWSRLSALAQAGHAEAVHLKTEMTAAGVEPGLETEPALPPLGNTASSEVSMPAIDHEVVIYEPLPDADPLLSMGEPNPLLAKAQPPLDESPPVPMPVMDLPMGELIAGTPLTVGVRVPASESRLAVKFWMTDVQSRNLLEKPRWLMTFPPNEIAEQTTFLQLQVPMGCLEVRFEAITVDLTNQQESYKTTLERRIAPVNLAAGEGT